MLNIWYELNSQRNPFVGRRAAADVPGDPVAHCPVAGATRTSVRGPGIKCDGQRRLRRALMKANQRSPPPEAGYS
jgi:hypothetical protein